MPQKLRQRREFGPASSLDTHSRFLFLEPTGLSVEYSQPA